jgi:hypothetical protein
MGSFNVQLGVLVRQDDEAAPKVVTRAAFEEIGSGIASVLDTGESADTVRRRALLTSSIGMLVVMMMWVLARVEDWED